MYSKGLLVSVDVATPVGLTLVGSSLPSSLSVMPVAAAITTPSQLGFTLGPPGELLLLILPIARLA